jgi:hypothetical protein
MLQIMDWVLLLILVDDELKYQMFVIEPRINNMIENLYDEKMDEVYLY